MSPTLTLSLVRPTVKNLRQAVRFAVPAAALLLGSEARAQFFRGNITVGQQPVAVAVNPVTNTTYVANYADDSVTAINGSTGATTTISNVGDGPVALAVNPATNMIYVANRGIGTSGTGSSIAVINGSTNAVTPLASGSEPFAIAVNPVTNRIYVADVGDTNLTVINGATNATATVGVNGLSSAIAVDTVTNMIYVASGVDLNVVNGANNAVASPITIPGEPTAIAVNPVTNTVYITSGTSNVVSVVSGATAGNAASVTATVTPGQTYPDAIAVDPATNMIYVANTNVSSVTVINGATNAFSVLTTGFNTPYGIAVNSLTNQVYVANADGSNVTVLNGATSTAPAAVTKMVTAGSGPTALALNPVTDTVYVCNSLGTNVSLISGATLVSNTVAVGRYPLAIAVNPVTNMLYVVNDGDATTQYYGSLTVLDANTMVVQATIPLDIEPSCIAINPVTNQIYVGGEGNYTYVDVVDGATNTVADSAYASGLPWVLIANPVTNKIYVASEGSRVTVIDGFTLASTTLSSGSDEVAFNPVTNKLYLSTGSGVLVYSGTTDALVATIAGSFGGPIAVNPVTNTIYVVSNANQEDDVLEVINGATNAITDSSIGIYFDTDNLAINTVTNTIYAIAQGSGGTGYLAVVNGFTNHVGVVYTPQFPTSVAVNEVTNEIFVGDTGPGSGNNNGGNQVSVVDGLTNNVTNVTVGASPEGPTRFAVNPVTGMVYVINQSGNSVTSIGTPPSLPLSVAINGVPSNETSITAPTIGFTAQSLFSPTAPPPQNVFYQVDSFLGTWTQATGGPSFSATLAALPLGLHVLYAFSEDAQDTISSQLSSAYTSQVAVYDFLVTLPATQLVLTAPSTAVVGTSFGVTVTAEDVNNSPVPAYLGTVAITSSDGAALLPPNSTLTDGSGTFTVTLNTGGNMTVTATDTVNTSLTVTSPAIAVATVPTHYVFSVPSTATVGQSFPVTVSAEDSSNSVVPTYEDSAYISSTDALASFPPYALTYFDLGVASFSVTLNTAGDQTITVTDAGGAVLVGTSGTIAVAAAPTPSPSPTPSPTPTPTPSPTPSPSPTPTPTPTPVPAVAPTIILQPTAQTVNTGAAASFWVVAHGTAPLAYQWSFNDSPITGATSSLLQVSNAQAANAGDYSVTVTNAGGSVTSNAPALTVSAATGAPPGFSLEPASETVALGSTAVFSVLAGTGAAGSFRVPAGHPPASPKISGGTTYQWFLDDVALSGDTDPTLVISNASASDAGTYLCIATSPEGSVASTAAILSVATTSNPGRLINLSCRANSVAGANELIAGFVVGGASTSGQENVLVRATGPTLANFGLSGVLADPQLTLDMSNSDGSNTLVQINTGWGDDAQVAAAANTVGAFSWDPASVDAALVEALGGGAYTAQVTGVANDSGIALAEVYDATPSGAYTAQSPRLINISARVNVGTGGNVLIAGFVIGGTTSKTVLIRATGPTLKNFGLSGSLPDPQLTLNQSNSDGSNTVLQTNTGWGGNAQVAAAANTVGAFSWDPASADSAILVTLPPGGYTAEVGGASKDTGIGLVEVYEVP